MIGERIKSVRTAKGMSQYELSAKCGISRFTLGKIENGKVPNMSVYTLVQIADALEVSADYLLCREC